MAIIYNKPKKKCTGKAGMGYLLCEGLWVSVEVALGRVAVAPGAHSALRWLPTRDSHWWLKEPPGSIFR
jgi:hypothetical protein